MGRDILKKKLNLIDKIIRNNMNIITLRSAYKVKEYHIQPCKQPNGLNLPFVKKVRYDSEGNSEMILTDAERNDPKSAYFIPEDETYYPSLYKFGSPFFALGCLIIVCMIAYLFLRFICKGCQGPKKSNTDDSSWGPWALIIIGFLISAIFFTMGLYYAAKQK